MTRKNPPVQDRVHLTVVKDRVLLAIVLVCAILCSTMIAWTISTITHESWMGMTFGGASTLGLLCLAERTKTKQ